MDHQTTPKTCSCCGRVLTRKRYPSGRIEPMASFKRRKYCCLACANTRKDSTKARKAEEVEQQAAKTAPPGDQQRQTAVQFLEGVINDESADLITRVNAAKALLPFQEKKVSASGKKEQQAEAAKEAGKGRFAPFSGPKVVQLKGQG